MCNEKPTFQTCFECNSQDDPNCATLQGDLQEKMCDDYLDSCKVYVKPNMTTHRGCSKEILSDGVECSAQSVNCKQCAESKCNGEIFPATRLYCFQCEGKNASDNCYTNLEGNTELSYPCRIYNFRDSCFLYVGDDNVAYRGCLSDQDNVTTSCLRNPEKCLTCQTSSCNSESVMKAPNISCITCDTNTSPECGWGFPIGSGAKCKKDRFFYEDESCFLLNVSDQSIRGCTMDTNVCRVSTRCELCETDICNRENVEQNSCWKCSSEDNDDCFAKPYHTESVNCSGIVTYEKRGCYTWLDKNNTVTRGCYSDLTEAQHSDCIDQDACERCVDDNFCNNEVRGSAGKASVHVIMMFILAVIVAVY